jgi:transcriptional regulator of acetoin/glycerol metabolism
MSAGSTTLTGSLESPAAPVPVPWLFVVLRAGAPLAPPSRHLLDGLRQVEIGRGERNDWERAGGSLRLRLDEARASSAHARLERVLHQWVIEDVGSRNGTVVNGAVVRRAALQDGDLIEIGHTFLLYRELVPAGGEAPDVRVEPGAGPTGLDTLRPDLAGELARLRMVAPSRETVMILGETGTGKELLARAVHELSGRAGELVAVNCGAVPETIVEAELFGHQRGAFSGAVGERRGLVRAADGGTLFLDEIGDLRLGSQTALLRTLQERQVRPVGSERAIDVDLRVVCATHRPLEQLVAEGGFRADLYARLRGFVIGLPALRERREDLGLIIAAILRAVAGPRAASVRLSGTAARSLFTRPWPGNVRELEKTLGVALTLAADGPVLAEHLGPPRAEIAAAPAAAPAAPAAPALDLDTILAALAANGDSVAAAARALGVHRNRIYRLLEQHGIRRGK